MHQRLRRSSTPLSAVSSVVTACCYHRSRMLLQWPTWCWSIVVPSVWVAGASKVWVVSCDGPLAPVDLLPLVVDVIPAQHAAQCSVPNHNH